MNEGTERLAMIVKDIEELAADAMVGNVHLKEAGRIGCYGVMLRAILKGQQDRDNRIAAQAASRGGLDYSTPTGDRDF